MPSDLVENINGLIYHIIFVLTSMSPGFLGQCMENLLFDQKFWLSSLGEDIAIEVSIQEDTLNLIYKGILMQEGQ